jgi:AbrB family looped-hinge helix DNA binding protein
MKTISMNDQGRMTLPAEVRKELGLTGSANFEVEVDDDGQRLVLRPVVTIPREDAWAYSAEHRAILKHALEDSAAGRVRRVTEKELRRLVGP